MMLPTCRAAQGLSLVIPVTHGRSLGGIALAALDGSEGGTGAAVEAASLAKCLFHRLRASEEVGVVSDVIGPE